MTKAMKDFIDTAISVMSSDPNDGSKHWPSKILDSMDDQEMELSNRVVETGDKEALNELMDSQAAKHFGGFKMSEMLPKDGRVVQELKGLLRNSKLLKDVINDTDILRALQME
jgi:hypothetical protein